MSFGVAVAVSFVSLQLVVGEGLLDGDAVLAVGDAVGLAVVDAAGDGVSVASGTARNDGRPPPPPPLGEALAEAVLLAVGDAVLLVVGFGLALLLADAGAEGVGHGDWLGLF